MIVVVKNNVSMNDLSENDIFVSAKQEHRIINSPVQVHLYLTIAFLRRKSIFENVLFSKCCIATIVLH